MIGTVDAASALMRAIGARFAGLELRLEEIRSRSWASVTFTGARHEAAIRIEGKGARGAVDRFLAGLEAADFRLKHHVLADIALVSDQRIDGEDAVLLQLEALTVEEG
jgi:hypothetical protein